MDQVKTHPAAEVVADPTAMGGEPVVRGTRIPAAAVATYLKAGHTHTDIFEAYPRLTVDGINAVRRLRAGSS